MIIHVEKRQTRIAMRSALPLLQSEATKRIIQKLLMDYLRGIFMITQVAGLVGGDAIPADAPTRSLSRRRNSA